MSNIAQRSFSFGELAPPYYSRTDLSAYASGLRTLRNAYVMRTGGVQNRPGTFYKGTTKSNGTARLVPCVFADDQNYVLEFGDAYVRFWKNGSPVTATVTGAWADATPYTVGIVVSYGGTNYVCLLAHTSNLANDRPSTGAAWQTYWYALSSTTYELPTPYQDTELSAMQFAQRPGVLTIVHPTYAPATLTRISNNVWDLANIDFTGADITPTSLTLDVGTAGTGWGYSVAVLVNNGSIVRGRACPFVRTNVVSTSLSAFIAAVAASPHEISWDAVSAVDAAVEFGSAASIIGYSIYLSKDAEGSLIRRLDVITEPGGGIPTSFVDDGAGWASAPSDSPLIGVTPFASSGNYPSVIGTYQQRTLFAATNNATDVVEGSRVGVPNDFDAGTTLEDDDPISFRLVSQRTVIINHLLEIAERFLCFTSAGEFVLTGGGDGILRPGEINPRQLSFNGSSDLTPLPIDDTALYVQARGNQIRNLVPANQDGYSGTELSRTASHLVDRYTMSAWCYQEIPHSTVWMVRSDGALVSLTYERESGVIGWAVHDTDGDFESICCVPEGQEDAVYVVVSRSIGGTKRYVERFAPRYQYGAINAPVPFMDCAIDVAVTATNTVTGLDHLNGEAVSVVIDRFLATDGQVLASPNNPAYAVVTVSAGAITVPGLDAANLIMVGLPITTDIQTLDIDNAGSSRKDAGINIKRVGLWMEDTVPPFAGKDVPATDAPTGMQRMPQQDEDGNTVTTDISGYREVNIDGAISRGGRILLRQVDPVPLTVLAIIPQGEFGRGS